MEESPTDPLEVSQNLELIKDAQKDLLQLDVLVCGHCHEVYHFIQEFQEHKSSTQCTGASSIKCQNEEKSQIWGFTLWKTKQVRTHKSKGEEVPTSWEIYQNWTKLEPTQKDLWVSAGKTLQYTNKIATSNVKEIKDELKPEKDPLALDEAFTGLENDLNSNDFLKTGVIKSVKVIAQGTKRALRTTKDNEKEEYNVEKIVAKRFNIRKKLWEYEVKWENYSTETWEPLSHLENCKALVQEYEDELKAKKEKEKEKAPAPRGRGRPRLNPLAPGTPAKVVLKKPAPPPAAIVLTTPGGRPQRTSKQKALSQVKQWCGSISDGEDGVLKRPLDDDGSDDSYEKRIKLEGESEDTEEDEPKPPVKKIAKIVHTYTNNGAGRKLPDNVLIPDAQGVVRISQKQLPSLSSGVYIMSKSSGIIKLDPAASKIATSGGQAIVKVNPRIGQTQIKIIRKDDGSKRLMQVKTPETISPGRTTRIVQQVINKSPIVKRELEKIMNKIEMSHRQSVQKSVVKEKEEVKLPITKDDDSDDGVEEMEFPTDLPLPEPDSPPGDFVLDPITGKIAGQEYPDPEPEPVINEPKKESPTETIDNIVKLAAADITEEDLKPDTNPLVAEKQAPVTVAATQVTQVTQVTVATTPTTTQTKTIVYAVATEPRKNQSILNKAIANSNILQKTLQTPRPKTQPRIINQSVARPRHSVNTVVRTPTTTAKVSPVRPKPTAQSVLPKPKFNIAPMNPANIRNVYTKSNNIPKKIGNTTVAKTPKPTAPKAIAPAVARKATPKTPVAVGPPKTPVVLGLPKTPVVLGPKPIISMPSLDEEPTVQQPILLAPKLGQVATETSTVETDLSTFTLATGDRPMLITADDGTVYQVAGQNEEGQTILVTQDSDGQQQCLLVTSEAIQEEEQVEDPAEVLMEGQELADGGEEQPLVAQFIRTEPPSPGGTHKVVVMLPDGDVMVTQVTPEEYATLALDK